MNDYKDFKLVERNVIVFAYSVVTKAREIGIVNRDVDPENGIRWTASLHLPVLVAEFGKHENTVALTEAGEIAFYPTSDDAAKAVVRTFRREYERETKDHSYHVGAKIEAA